MSTILITGAKGQLGTAFSVLASNFPAYTLVLTDKETLDITNFEAVSQWVVQHNVQIIINCAAYTQVDNAEEEIATAYKINVEGVKNLAEIAKQQQLKLIHISTDYVFDGYSSTPYLETDETNPKNQYGLTKLLGENAIKNINPPNTLIIRTAWLYGTTGHNFVKTILRLSKEHSEIRVVNDQIGAPTFANDLAMAIFTILPKINNTQVALYHYTNQGSCSWYQFAQEILKNIQSSCQVLPISSAEFNAKAHRPHYSLLNTEKIKQTFQLSIPNWKDSLHKCIETIKESSQIS